MWNRIVSIILLIAAGISLLVTPIEVEARGGRGGGGRGGGGRGGGGRSSVGARGGGSYRGGRTMNRTPTMSRASNRTPNRSRSAVSQVRRQPQNRPSISQGNRAQQSRQRVQQRPSASNRAELRNQVNRYAQSRPSQNIDRQALAQRAQNFSNKRGNQITQNRQLSDRASQRLRNSHPNSRDWFDRDFFDRHNLDLDYMGIGANWWRPAAWGALASWGAWNWSTPYYYDDGGYSYPITYTSTESTYVYPYSTGTVTSQPVQRTQTTASTSEGDWLPLGVFAVASTPNTAMQTSRFIQLAINRSGEIAGVLYNSVTDDAQDLTGKVDANTQKAYWSLDNQSDSPIASTGIYNLTEDQTPINVHFTDGSDQTWTLVRLQQE